MMAFTNSDYFPVQCLTVWFQAFSQNFDKRLLASSCLCVTLSHLLSVFPPAWNNSFPTQRIFMKF